MATTKTAVLTEGNSAEVAVEWRNLDGAPESPVAVRYQVFDHVDGDAVSPVVDVADAAQTMVVVVPGAHLPSSRTAARRRLALQIEASFADGGIHTEMLEVYVQRRFGFA